MKHHGSLQRCLHLCIVLMAAMAGCRSETRAEIPWKKSYPLALESAIQEGRPILIYWNADWCAICRRIEQESFTRPEIAGAMANFVPVAINVDADKALSAKYGVEALPMLMLLDTRGEVAGQVMGYLNYDDLLALLNNWARSVNRSES